MNKIIINTIKETVTEKTLTEEELVQREADRLAWEEEQAKPQPPTLEEQLAQKDLQMKALENQQKQLNDDVAAFMEFILSGGM